ncbi:MAG: DUF885 domain-containing protein, partial [Massilia sp.]|nr:DUF885 domain-containing protein [Massilia sp.]
GSTHRHGNVARRDRATRGELVHAAVDREGVTRGEGRSARAEVTLDIFLLEKERLLKAAAFYPYLVYPITNQEGIHLSFPQLVAQMPFNNEADYRNYLSRIDALPRHIDGLIEQMREGMKSGWVAPKAAVRAVPAMLQQLREELVTGNLGLPFREIPGTIPKGVRDELAQAGPAALRTRAAPALQKLEEFLRSEYLPAAREAIVNAGGAEYYQFLVSASTELRAAEVHALGLKEVARIRAEMAAAIARTGFKGSFKEFVVFANNDPRLFASSPELLLARYRRIVNRASTGLPRLFLNVPAEELVVKPMQALGADKQGAAYYEAGAADRPAALVINTSKLETRPLWETETLALHEGVPGHHLQAARARELVDLPAFRRFGWYGAFGEGWALYAESLGADLGFYRDAFSAFGHLNAALLRAARLVADTGIHTQGWTRQQAIDYLAANTANAPADNEVEVDRYIAAPGQVLGYKLGQMKIEALREKARAALGERFDLRRFHEALLDNGPLPLPLLEQQIERWIKSEAKAALPEKAAS